jgi:rhodanese-related sulfurtransferase
MSDHSPSRSGPALGAGYAGDVAPEDCWERLAREPEAQLVDVRTEAEWNFVGLPDLQPLNRRPILCEWQFFPPAPNPGFLGEVEEALKRTSYKKGAALFFLCRSGARSAAAATAMTAAGFGPCFNIADGFEGALDPESHRGEKAGWKAKELPWVQT